MNDPFEGGMHLPDIFVFKPLYFEGERIAFAATICHHTDVGGRVAGSNASDSTEIYQEGLRIPPIKLHDRGKANERLLALFPALLFLIALTSFFSTDLIQQMVTALAQVAPR